MKAVRRIVMKCPSPSEFTDARDKMSVNMMNLKEFDKDACAQPRLQASDRSQLLAGQHEANLTVNNPKESSDAQESTVAEGSN
ncbi:hypothetical protein B9Z55_017527 [Caenorhabditis nigoni]|uniref:Uncharacterized protein n=1 Tax=Caenorhabditis nigoni TaxID=1611254 RepID=A0A2G5T9U6_9PELO|nr:hypothetical protein B9Z55_017527 [Caenorhabditis nigoni]